MCQLRSAILKIAPPFSTTLIFAFVALRLSVDERTYVRRRRVVLNDNAVSSRKITADSSSALTSAVRQQQQQAY